MKNTTPDQNKYKEIKRAQPNRTNALCQLGEAFFSVFSKTMKKHHTISKQTGNTKNPKGVNPTEKMFCAG